MRSFYLASAVSLITLGLSTTARAAEPGSLSSPSEASSAPTTPNEKPAAAPDGAPDKRFVVTANPLSILIGRYSIQGEYLLAPHHALTLNPVVTYAPITITTNGKEVDGGSLFGVGGEFGYRFYSNRKRPEGFFIGPSVLLASYTQSAPSGAVTGGASKGGSDSFLSYGGALDLGGQAVIGPGVVFSAGFGLQYTKTSKDIATDNLNLASAIIAGGGIRPRVLLSVGYAF